MQVAVGRYGRFDCRPAFAVEFDASERRSVAESDFRLAGKSCVVEGKRNAPLHGLAGRIEQRGDRARSAARRRIDHQPAVPIAPVQTSQMYHISVKDPPVTLIELDPSAHDFQRLGRVVEARTAPKCMDSRAQQVRKTRRTVVEILRERFDDGLRASSVETRCVFERLRRAGLFREHSVQVHRQGGWTHDVALLLREFQLHQLEPGLSLRPDGQLLQDVPSGIQAGRQGRRGGRKLRA